MDNQGNFQPVNQERMKYCRFCGARIPEDAIICSHCGRQVEELKREAPQQQPQQIVINNTNSNVNTNNNTAAVNGAMVGMNPKNKWVALILAIVLGFVGAHKFYEGKFMMGVLYIFTGGLFFIGVILDILALLTKPNPYYVK